MCWTKVFSRGLQFYSPLSILHCLPSLLAFFCFPFLLICNPSRELHFWVKFLFASYLLSPGHYYYYFFFLLALLKGLIWKYHILTGESTLLSDLFAVTASFLKHSSREEIFLFQGRKRMSCSVAMKDNELSLSVTVKPLEKHNRPWERGLDIDVLAILACLGTRWLPCLCRKKWSLCKVGISAEGREKECLVFCGSQCSSSQVSGLVGTRGHWESLAGSCCRWRVAPAVSRVC